MDGRSAKKEKKSIWMHPTDNILSESWKQYMLPSSLSMKVWNGLNWSIVREIQTVMTYEGDFVTGKGPRETSRSSKPKA